MVALCGGGKERKQFTFTHSYDQKARLKQPNNMLPLVKLNIPNNRVVSGFPGGRVKTKAEKGTKNCIAFIKPYGTYKAENFSH